MRDDLIKDVKIIEPPIQELSKRKFGFVMACLSGCGCLLLVTVGAIIGLKIYIGQGPQKLKTLPENLPKEIFIYDQYNIEKITFISGKYKSRSLGVAALFPKIILSPLLISLMDGSIGGVNGDDSSTSSKKAGAYSFWRLITAPVTDNRDSIQIEWRDIQVEPNYMLRVYKNKLQEKQFKIDSESEGKNFQQFTFTRDDGIDGTVYAQHPENGKKIDYAFLLVNVPNNLQE